MSSIKKFMRDAATAKRKGYSSISGLYTGVGHRVNMATGDRGPDAPKRGGPNVPRDDRPGRRPRGRQRSAGGDVRTPLST
jgi:hypothetical protein